MTQVLLNEIQNSQDELIIIDYNLMNDYKKGEVACFGWKLDRVQVRITDKHYINNFVDYVCSNNRMLLDVDKLDSCYKYGYKALSIAAVTCDSSFKFHS